MTEPTELTAKYPRRFGPFVLVTPLLESGGVSLCPALRLRRGRAQPCLVTHMRPGGKHAGSLEARFRRASETARRLHHHGVAKTLAIGRLDDHLFVAHEFLEGAHLGRLPAPAIDAPSAAFIAHEVAEALRYLHGFEGRALVHHGICPANVHLGWDGHVKLFECGLAIGVLDQGDEPMRSFRGGARYLAPEIRDGGRGDARSDVFSVGVLLWELLAQRNWMGDDVLSRGESAPTLRADETTDRGPPSAVPRVPAALYALVAKAMSRDPARRFQDAAELTEALVPFSPGKWLGHRSVRQLVRRVFDMDDSQSRLHANLAAALPLLKGDSDEISTRSGNLQGGKAWALPLAGAAAVAALALYGPWKQGDRHAAARITPPLVATERAPASSAPALPPPSPPAPFELEPEPPAPVAAPEPATEILPPAAASERPSPPSKARAGGRAKASGGRAEASARAFEVLASAEDRFQWGDLEGAETLARTAVRNLATSPRAFYLLGVVLLARGDANKAKDAFERTLALDPTYTDADAKLRLATERAALSKSN
ncbi:MAG TPA: protein kinase [Polyangia bacterium]